jgi:transposase
VFGLLKQSERCRVGNDRAALTPAQSAGTPAEDGMRSIVNAMFYMARTGCQWQQLPREFPPFTTVQHYFHGWPDGGVLERINFELWLQARETAGREPSPSAGVIDSQSVKTIEAGGPRGFETLQENLLPLKDYGVDMPEDIATLHYGVNELLRADLLRGSGGELRYESVTARGETLLTAKKDG